jgi:histidinol-phosphate aminotransferase
MYQKPADAGSGLRLHQNENTGGCSPRVIEALRQLQPNDISSYPIYTAATQRVAGHFGVGLENVVLTNGLNEGILAAAIVYLRSHEAFVPEAIVPEPAFEIFRINIGIAGGKPIVVPPQPDFIFPEEAVRSAITPRTRLIFLSNPNNPTGVSTPLAAIRAIARAIPAEAIVFVDEAYGEFAPHSFLPGLAEFPNVIVGRTFSKAFGLAGLRIGCVIGSAAVLSKLRAALPVYSVNIAAITALTAALADTEHVRSYASEVAQSKEILYAACRRLGLGFWPSDANFVLVHAGERTGPLLEGLAARGVHVRARSTEAGCDGCVRIVAGVVQHTEQCIAAMEEVLCEAR